MEQKELTFKSGLPGFDKMLQRLEPGDNVVLKVGEVEDYLPFARAFARQCADDRIPCIYFRFARHRPVLEDLAGIELRELDPAVGFEAFIGEILATIEQAGRGACYVFDCLSDLAVDWYSERMLGNFFMLACPYLYQLDTVAYFALIRDRHSPMAVNAITTTAQVVVDIYRGAERIFAHPLKVEKRFSKTMYALHVWHRENDRFEPVRDSATMSTILAESTQPWLEFAIQRADVWTEAFMAARQAAEADGGANGESARLYDRLLRMAVTRNDEFIDLARRYFSLRDLVAIVKRMVGTGLIGGKSLGMLLARAILIDHDPHWRQRLEAHDSFFVGSDVFYTFLVLNRCWWPKRRCHDEPLESYLERAGEVQSLIERGEFPADIMEQFAEMLNYFGQSPIIVRSSSLQEDNYGNAFSGKYESVFCANQGNPEQRMQHFLAAVRRVYASTMSREALLYRDQRGLLDQDEQMALLVQRVSGAAGGRCFLPPMAGVAFSYNPYVWGPGIEAEAGMLRLVLGLGTRAVDRLEDDYTRLVALNAPLQRPDAHARDPERYSQKRVDVIDLAENRFATVTLAEAIGELEPQVAERLTVFNLELARRARQMKADESIARTLDFTRILQSSLPTEMRQMARLLQTAYNTPVDLEFTVNFTNRQEFLINLVQCRPFQVRLDIAGQSMPPSKAETDPDKLILRSAGPIIGQGLATRLDRIVYIVPAVYSRLSEQDRYSVARVIGRLTRCPENRDRPMMLIGPGRWGTSSPSLGVPVSFSEINTVKVLCEMAVMHEGLIPDISLGTHFFNDLVEMNMLYLAVFPGRQGNAINQDRLLALPNRLARMLPDDAAWAQAVHVADGDPDRGEGFYLHADSARQQATCRLP